MSDIDPGQFQTTHWTTVLQARDRVTSEEGEAALDRLCRRYWRPLYFFARRRGQLPHDAEDLVQGFFAKLLAKDYLRSLDPGAGRFRTFLLTAFSGYMANEWDHARRLKRGGGCTWIPLDAATAEETYRLEPVDGLTPEVLYDRQWGETVVGAVVERLEREYREAGDGGRFAALRPMLMGGAGEVRYVELAEALGLSEGGVKTLVRRLRLRFGSILREELLQTVVDPGEVEGEMRYLLEALTK